MAKRPPKQRPSVVAHAVELWEISQLKPHPQNYRSHPDEQLKHLQKSIEQHGFYRNAVVARDGTLLAGHGVVETAKKMGVKAVPVIKLDIAPDSAAALKVLTGDNQIPGLGVVDDRALMKLLKEISENDPSGLLGTGASELTLERLLAAAMPLDAMEAWKGMPEFDQKDKTAFRHIVVNFKSHAAAAKFGEAIGQSITEDTRSIWYPKAPIERLMNKRYKKA